MDLTTAPVRMARPSADLDSARRFWVDGVGLSVLWETGPDHQEGHALLMVGPQAAQWHLELVHDPAALAANPPGPEDLLVLYLGEQPAEDTLQRIGAHGGTRVAARNPYWDRWGFTFEDPDGYRLVLSHRTWG